jgi:hypothetical protein
MISLLILGSILTFLVLVFASRPDYKSGWDGPMMKK